MNKKLQKLLAKDANIPVETVPTLLTELEKLQTGMRVVDNHLLIIASQMVERKRMVDKEVSAERRAAFYDYTLGLVRRAVKAVGRTAVKVVTAPVAAIRTRLTSSTEEPKPKTKKAGAKRTRRASTSRSKKSDAKKVAAPAAASVTS